LTPGCGCGVCFCIVDGPEMSAEDHGYSLVCVRCGWESRSDDHLIHCPACGREAFLVTRYDRDPPPDAPLDSLAGWEAWLPFELTVPVHDLRTGCVSAASLAAAVGVRELWVIISGWEPELGATLPTCTFKTLEAVGVMLRVASRTDRTLIVSSAGNAGLAVLDFSLRHAWPAVVVVPREACEGMLVCDARRSEAPLLVCLDGATYPDAIAMVGAVQLMFPENLVREGGAWNVARRDAMAVPVLSAVTRMGRMPDHYVQAVGSGTGGIAAHEAVGRLVAASLVEPGRMSLHLVQNHPFTPMVDAWNRGATHVEPMGPDEVRRRLAMTFSTVLANADPPYGVAGGVREVVEASRGDLVAVDNEEAAVASRLLEEHMGIRPYPEAAVALAGLSRQVSTGKIASGDTVLLHVTGSGWERSVVDLHKRPFAPDVVADRDDVETVAQAVEVYLDKRMSC